MRRALIALTLLAWSCARPPPLDHAASSEQALEPRGARAPDRGAIDVTLETSEGPVHCALDPEHAPRAVALFVGFARGGIERRDDAGVPTRAPLYRDLTFFRAIEGAYVQSGCSRGDGTSSPGFRIPAETRADDAARLAKPGALAFAVYHAPPDRPDPSPPPPGDTVGSQFIVTLGDMSHLAGELPVLGTCSDLDVVARLAARAARHDPAARLVRVDVR